MRNYDNFINGRFVPSSGTSRIEVTNPSTGQPICTVPDSTAADVDAAIAAAEAAQKRLGQTAGHRARPGAARDRRQDPRTRRTAGAHHHRRAGQDSGPGARRGGLHGRLPGLHGRMGAPHRGRDSRKRSPGRNHLPVPPAHRRDRRHPALELPVLPDRPQGRPRPGHGQHHRDQAQQGNAPQRRQVLRAGGGNRPAPGRHQRRPRPRRRRRRRPLPPTRASA